MKKIVNSTATGAKFRYEDDDNNLIIIGWLNGRNLNYFVMPLINGYVLFDSIFARFIECESVRDAERTIENRLANSRVIHKSKDAMDVIYNGVLAFRVSTSSLTTVVDTMYKCSPRTNRFFVKSDPGEGRFIDAYTSTIYKQGEPIKGSDILNVWNRIVA